MAALNKQTGRLVLTPDPAQPAPQRDSLLVYLNDIGFIGTPLKDTKTAAFLVGDVFLRLITFMGCAPNIELEPPMDGGSFCHIRLAGPWPKPRLLRGRNTQPPRCMHCRSRLPEWERDLDVWCEDPTHADVLCVRCGRGQHPVDLLWRQNAGFGCLFVTVEDVFPGEAVPVPGLMKGLGQTTGSVWQYFYIRD
jgi:hypothetical protein